MHSYSSLRHQTTQTSTQLPGTNHYLLLQEWNFITATTQDAMLLFHIPKEATVQSACRITSINSSLQKRAPSYSLVRRAIQTRFHYFEAQEVAIWQDVPFILSLSKDTSEFRKHPLEYPMIPDVVEDTIKGTYCINTVPVNAHSSRCQCDACAQYQWQTDI